VKQETVATRIRVSAVERASGQLHDATIAEIFDGLDRAGFIVLADLVPERTCDFLAASVVEDVRRIRLRDESTRHEISTAPGHLQLGLRRYGEFVAPEVVANPLLEHAVGAVLGQGAWLGFYNGNVNCPGSGYQPWHFDRPYSWKTPAQAQADGVAWPPPTTTLSCSLALTDISVDTGATEVMPGTHRETAVTGWPAGERPENHPELLRHWGPAVSMEIPKGGICLRDPRMWHRGVPNTSASVRPMMALTYHAAEARHWRGLIVQGLSDQLLARCVADPALRLLDDGSLGDGRLVFEASARPAFAALAGPVQRNVRFVEEQWVVNHFVDAHVMGGAGVQKDGARDPWAGA
tara:strand:- start:220 stop:1269 length:1050 start_codon:yes stop_codon:yes gene_type:complete